MPLEPPKANPKEIMELFVPEGEKPAGRQAIEIFIITAWIFLALWIDWLELDFFGGSWVGGAVAVLINLPIFMCPTLIAHYRHHPKTTVIGVLNAALSPILLVAVFSRASYARDFFIVFLIGYWAVIGWALFGSPKRKDTASPLT